MIIINQRNRLTIAILLPTNKLTIASHCVKVIIKTNKKTIYYHIYCKAFVFILCISFAVFSSIFSSYCREVSPLWHCVWWWMIILNANIVFLPMHCNILCFRYLRIMVMPRRCVGSWKYRVMTSFKKVLRLVMLSKRTLAIFGLLL